MIIQRKPLTDIFGGNGNVITLVGKATAQKPNRLQHLYKQT